VIDMALANTNSHAPNGRSVYANTSCDGGIGFIAVSDLLREFVGNLFPVRALPDGHVAHIFSACSKIKMVWIHAKAVIAFVKDLLVSRWLSKSNAPRNSMRTMLFPKHYHFSRLIRVFRAWCVPSSNPLPAPVWSGFPFSIEAPFQEAGANA
jgi:hypothetical protein